MSSKSKHDRNRTDVSGDGNFVVSSHVGGDLHVRVGRHWFQNKKVRVSVAIGTAALLIGGAIFAYLQYRKDSTAAPLTVAADAVTPTCGTAWVVPKSPDQIDISQFTASVVMQRGWRDWSAGADGAAAANNISGAHVQFTIQGRSATQVVLTDMKVRVVERNPPITGTFVSRECGDQWAWRWMNVDLDAEPPKSVPTNALEPGATIAGVADFESKPIRFPYRVAESEAETFMFNALTLKCDCRWVVDVYWSSAGESGVLTVDDHGKPFRTTSDANAVKCRIRNELLCE
ncbi:hypothetical protein Lesp02_44620 [Lentzea sp. NBRC 105346]|uniref:hypothetical protein n=1 Tax=Lentzea sp. NBRC 105346 TaxID=3032205 RepID=UPI0024A3194C|nr:hypothetical protein [Lentzea sp. NBRC 105346]GLZ32274.1 hypothetical protein Lesp02_44620 [Lentzea sp. NBRC 105346]